MLQNAEVLDPERLAVDAEVGEFADRITEYARNFHGRFPHLPLRQCVEMGAGHVMGPCHPDSPRVRLVHMALAEMAGRWLVAQQADATPVN